MSRGLFCYPWTHSIKCLLLSSPDWPVKTIMILIIQVRKEPFMQDAFDYELMIETMQNLKKGRQVEIPYYDFTTHSRLAKTKSVYGASVVVFEGILIFHDQKLRDLMDLKIFVDTDSDIRLARRCILWN